MDVRYALRRLAQNPAFAITACVSLALGIGANTAAFSVVYAVLFRTLPVRDPGSLALVSTRYMGFQYSMSYPAYTYLRDHSSSLDGLVSFRAQPLNVGAGGRTERVPGMLVSGNYFDVLGAGMSAGTAIHAEDDRVPGSGGERGLVAVLSHQYWKNRFNSDASVIGSPVRINGHPFTIVGVAAPGFRGTRVGSLPEIFVPMMFAPRVFDLPNWLSNPRNNWSRIIARLKRDTSLGQAQSEMTLVFRRFNQEIIAPLATTDAARARARQGIIVLEPGQAGLLEMGNTVRPTMYALMGLVTVVLLIACVNVANLMVARAERVHRQTAICLALGATRTRVWTQNLIESCAIGAVGVTLGLVLAVWMRRLLLQLVPVGQQLDVAMDGRVFAVSVLVGAVTTIVLASITARQSLRVGVLRALKGDDVTARLWLRKGLIVAQLALSIVVLVAAALFARTLNQLRLVEPGFATERILIASTAPEGYSREQLKSFYARLIEEVRSIPGVVSAALANDQPLNVNTGWNIVVRRDRGGPPQQVGASIAFVSPGYFKTMGIPLLRGRDLDERDEANPSGAVIVNENFVRTYLAPAQEPIGASIAGNGNMTFEIVGVVKDSASTGLRDLDQHMMYVPGGRGVLHVRAAVPPATLAASIQSAVHRLDPDVPVFDVRTIDQQIDRSVRSERTFAMLSSTFGVLAVVLSAVGLYGVMANAVSRRTRELGIRLALGAGPRRIVQMVFREAAVLMILGAGVGVPAALALAHAIRGLLFNVQPADWRSVAAALVLLAAVAVVSAWVPARRASRLDPLVALRAE